MKVVWRRVAQRYSAFCVAMMHKIMTLSSSESTKPRQGCPRYNQSAKGHVRKVISTQKDKGAVNPSILFA